MDFESVTLLLFLLTSIGTANSDDVLNENGWLTVAACRAKCLYKFVGSNVTDQKCIKHKACFPCWHHCEAFYSSSIRNTFCIPSTKKKCARGCKTACKFYKRNSDLSVQQDWVFPVQASGRSSSFGEVSVSWARPRLISSKKQSLASSLRVSVVYVLFTVDDFNSNPLKVSMTCNTKDTLHFEPDVNPSLAVLLVAVSFRGELTRHYADVFFRPSRPAPPGPSIMDLPRAHSSSSRTISERIRHIGKIKAVSEVDNITTLQTKIDTHSTKSKIHKHSEPNLIWILTTVLLVVFLLGCLLAVIYFTCYAHRCFNCNFPPVNFSTTNFKLNTGVSPANIEEQSVDLEFPSGMIQSSVAQSESSMAARHTTPNTEEGAQHLVRVDVHQSENPVPSETPSPIPYPDSRQDVDANSYCDLQFQDDEHQSNILDITHCGLQACLRDEFRRHIIAMLSTEPPPPPPRCVSLSSSATCSSEYYTDSLRSGIPSRCMYHSATVANLTENSI